MKQAETEVVMGHEQPRDQKGRRRLRWWLCLGGILAPLATLGAQGADRVVLLHGLGRGPASMWPLARSLRTAGYEVLAPGYPSQSAPIAELAERTLGPVFAEPSSGGKIHLVTHSLGGILLRAYLHERGVPPNLGRVVMLAPPNGGSEIVDRLASWRLYRRINGPAGLDLGTASDHAPARLGPLPPDVEVGVIAGSFSWNPLFSALIAGPDDGKVAVARTHVAGEADHLTLRYSHTWLMNRAETRRQVLSFVRDGRFDPPPSVAGQIADMKKPHRKRCGQKWETRRATQ